MIPFQASLVFAASMGHESGAASDDSAMASAPAFFLYQNCVRTPFVEVSWGCWLSESRFPRLL